MKFGPDTRVAFVAEELSRRPDEGALRTLDRLASYLHERTRLRVFHCRGEAPDALAAKKLRFTRAGITRSLWSALREAAPECVLYAPSASLTINAFWRAWLIRRASRAPVVVVGLQRRECPGIARPLLKLLAPDALLVTSGGTACEYAGLGSRVLELGLGVDRERFRPIEEGPRTAVREEMGWNDARTTVLHVGHLRSGRGLSSLAALAEDPSLRIVVVASVSERGEEHLARSLVAAGVELHHEYMPDIERFYQAADAYLFPVREQASAIDLPLSVLEALACGLPVLSTRYGALPEHFEGRGGLRFLEANEGVGAALAELLARDADPAALVAGYGWDDVFERWLDAIAEVLR